MTQPNQSSTDHNKEKIESVNPSEAIYRFDSLDENAANHLSIHGFVVIKNILNNKEIIYAKKLLWNFLSRLGWKRKDPNTWDTHEVTQKGMIWCKGAGQSELQWFIRTRPRIIKAFADIWSMQDIYKKNGITFDWQKDIITSMDAFNVFRPFYLNNISAASKWKTQSGWYHIDQNIARAPHIETIQGIVSLYDEDKSTGSTVFIPGSHKWVKSLLPNLSKNKMDFVMISKKKLDNMYPKKILLCCKAGDLILWDSRCIHCSSHALISEQEMRDIHSAKLVQRLQNCNVKQVDEKEEKSCEIDKKLYKKIMNCKDIDDIDVPSLLRAVSYVCMAPKIKVKSKDVIRQKIAAYESKSTCSHFPHMCRILYQEENMKRKSINGIKNELIKSLIGLDILKDKKYDNIVDECSDNGNMNEKLKGKKNKFKKRKK